LEVGVAVPVSIKKRDDIVHWKVQQETSV